MKRLHCITILAVVVPCSMVRAGPVLLASFNNHVFGPGFVAPGTPVSFILEINGTGESGVLGDGILWNEGDSGTIDFTADNDPSFDVFARLLTNGIDDTLGDGIMWEGPVSGGGAISRNDESVLFARFPGFPDLTGNSLELIQLRVHSILFERVGVPPEQDELSINYSLTYDFFGTAIPEPSVLVLVAIGCSAIGGRKRIASPFTTRRIVR